jgi:hypothetical protein
MPNLKGKLALPEPLHAVEAFVEMVEEPCMFLALMASACHVGHVALSH